MRDTAKKLKRRLGDGYESVERLLIAWWMATRMAISGQARLLTIQAYLSPT
jgi:hypothetical protein